MINIKNISLRFGEKVIFDDISCMLKDNSRIGIVGENGTGKTTLLKSILGTVYLDKGDIELSARDTIAYLDQESSEMEPVNIIEYLKKASGIATLEQEIARLEESIAISDHGSNEYQTILRQYEKVSDLFSIKEGYSFESKAKRMLKGLGFKESDFFKKCSEFSGGWKIRISLTLILLKQPDIMLLDEPTNHLDTESMEWLENYLKDYRGTIITISHDHKFLDNIVKNIFELNRGKLEIYKGNFSYYQREKEKRIELLKKEMEAQASEIAKIRDFIERFRSKATKAKQVQSRIKMLEKYEIVTLAEQRKSVKISFPEYLKSGNDVLMGRGLTKHYGENQVFNNLNFTVYRGERVALVGVNGAGKSTLSRLISRHEEPTAGSINYGVNVKAAYFSQQSSENLDNSKTIWAEINSVSTKFLENQKRNMLGAFLFHGEDIYKKIAVLSGGEKSRLALLKILLQESNLLILDEPTNHLDQRTKEVFQKALLEYHGTVLIVSHDRFFLDNLVDKVFEISDGKLNEYSGNYSYFIYKRDERRALASQERLKEGPNRTFTSTADIVSDINSGTYKSKEQKRQEAEDRNKLSKIKKKIQKKLDAVELTISDYEERKEELESALCDPVVLSNSAKIIELNKDLSRISSELEKLYEEWEGITEELENATIG